MSKSVRFLAFALFAVVCDTESVAAASGPPVSAQAALAGPSDSLFGSSVAIDGNTAVVGAPNGNANQGAVYVYVRSGTTWTQQQMLTASDGAVGDQFGYAVAVSGNNVVVGAAGKANVQGAAYFFSRTGATWTQLQEFVLADRLDGDSFGGAVTISGTTALIGASGKFGGTGAAYLLTLSGGTWTQQNEFSGQAGEAFGTAVALDPAASTAVIGAPAANSGTGHVYVQIANGSIWPQQAIFAASDGIAGDNFGYSVAAGTNIAIVGAYANSGKGAAYVFDRYGTGWSQQAKLTASDGAAGDNFGFAVALSGGNAIVGAYGNSGSFGPGAAYAFTMNGAAWPQTKVVAPASGEYFGYAVAISASTAVVGGFGAANDEGAASIEVLAPVPMPALGTVALATLAMILAACGLLASRGSARRQMPTAYP